MKAKKITISLAVAAALFAGAVLVNVRLSAIRSTPPLESMTFLPGSERIKPFMLGFNTTYAHYLWIRTVIYTGEHYFGDKKFVWLTPMVDMITRLHPHFHEAYEYAGLMIPDLTGDTDMAKVILERGVNVFGTQKWNIPFFLGMLYYRYYDDPERAALNMSLAAQAPGEFQGRLAGLSATFFNKADRETEAIEVLMFLYETSENPEVKRHIEAKIEELLDSGNAEIYPK